MTSLFWSQVTNRNPSTGRGYGQLLLPSDPSSASSQSYSKHPEGPSVSDNAENEPADTQVTNHPPVAKDDRLRTEANNQVVASILDNDNDPDGDKLNIISVTSPTKRGSTVTINDIVSAQ